MRGRRQRGGKHVVGAGTFIDGGRGEIDGDGGDRVVDGGGRRAAADDEALEAAAGDTGDAGREAGGVTIDVLAVAGGNGQRAAGGAIGDADIALVGVDGGDAVRGRRQRGGEDVIGAGTFIDGGRGEVDGDGGDRVVDGGGRRAAADDEALEAAAGDTGDGGREAGGVTIDVLAVAGGDGQRAAGGAVGDADIALVGVDGGDAVRGRRQRGGKHVVGAGNLHRRWTR